MLGFGFLPTTGTGKNLKKKINAGAPPNPNNWNAASTETRKKRVAAQT